MPDLNLKKINTTFQRVVDKISRMRNRARPVYSDERKASWREYLEARRESDISKYGRFDYHRAKKEFNDFMDGRTSELKFKKGGTVVKKPVKKSVKKSIRRKK